MAHLRLNVTGMRGPACQEKIERALGRVPGVWAVVTCLDPGYLDVEYADDNGPDTEALIGAVERAGYRAKTWPGTCSTHVAGGAGIVRQRGTVQAGEC